MSKRLFDLLLSSLGLLVLAPVLLALALAVKLDSRGPVFFRQERVGRFGQPFRIHKFRTMRHDPVGQGLQSPWGKTPASRVWVRSCAKPSWTSCPSCWTCGWAT